MIKRVVIELLTIIVLLLSMTGIAFSATTIISTNADKDVVDSINTDPDNPLADSETVEIKAKVETEVEKQFEYKLQDVDTYIDEYIDKLGPQYEREIKLFEAYDYEFDVATNGENLKIGVINEIKTESKNRWKEAAKKYWNEHEKEIKERITNEVKKQSTTLIESYSRVVVQAMFDPIYDEIEAQINDSVPIVGTVCTNLINRYVNSLKIDTVIANEVKRNVGLEIKKYKIKEFDWGEEAIRAGFSALGSEASNLATELFDEATMKALEKLGINTSKTDLDEAITDWMGIQIEATVQEWTKNAIDYVLNNNAYDDLVKEMTKQSIEKFGQEMTEKMKEDIAKQAKEAIAKQKLAAENRLAEIKEAAVERIAESIGDLASDYALDLYENLEDELDKFGKNFGKFGNSVIRGLSNQLKTWIAGNVYENVATYLKNAFLGKNGELKWENFEIDWTRLGANVLLNILLDDSLADKLDLVYGMISSVGGLISGPVPFEAYSKLYFMFALRVPTATTATTSTTALSAASTGIQAGDFGAASDIYDPTQFAPLTDNLLITAVGPREALQFSTAHLKSIGSPVPILVEPTAKTISHFVPLWTAVFAPGVPLWADTAYILCEMRANTNKSSYVQLAFSTSTFGAMYGRPPKPTFWSAVLNAEAWAFQAFTAASAAAGGYRNSLEDLTSTAVSRYHEEAGMFVIGPFKVDYIRGYFLAGLKGKADFGMMVDMNIYDQEGNKIPQSSWAIMYSEDGQFDHDTRLLDEGYMYPYPKEEFYIGISQFSNQDVTSISSIRMEFKEMQVAGYGIVMGIQDFLCTYFPMAVVTGTIGLSHIPVWDNFLTMGPVPGSVPGIPHSLAAQLVTKYYLDHSLTIYLHKKDSSIPGWESAEYTTTSSVKTNGVEFATISPAVAGNSALHRTVDRIIQKYETACPYSATGVTFLDNMTKAYQIYSNLGYNPTFLEATSILLKVYGKNDWARAVYAVDAITGKDGTTFSKTIKVASVLVKDEKLQRLMNGVANIVELYELDKKKNRSDQEIGLATIRIAADTSGDPEMKLLSNNITKLVESSAYKDEVWNAACQMDMNNEQLDAYLQAQYPNLSATQRQGVIDEARQLRNLVYNSGDAGKQVSVIMQSCQQAKNKSKSPLEITKNLGYAFGVENSTTIINAIDRASGTSAEKQAILDNPNLNDEQKEQKIRELEMDLIQTGIQVVKATNQGNSSVSNLSDYYQAAEDIIKIEESQKRINEIKADSSLSDKEKAEKITAEEQRLARTGIDTVKTLEIINSKEYQDSRELIANYGKVKEANEKIKEIEADTTLSQEQKTEKIEEQKDIIEKNGMDTAKEPEKTNAQVYDIAIDAYKSNSNLEVETAKEFQKAIDGMNREEIISLAKSYGKAESTEQALEIIKEANARKDLESSEQGSNRQSFIDELDKLNGAQLYDTSSYTEYDSDFNITRVERPTEVYYMDDDEIGLTMSIGGVVWKDGHSGFQNDYDGIRNANVNGDLEIGIEGVKVVLKSERTGKLGRMRVDNQWIDAITYTDEGGYYHFAEVEAGKYYVEFEYDGEKYMATTYISDGEKEGDIWNYQLFPDLEQYDNNSKAAEDEDEREAFNDKFYEITHGTAIGKDGTITDLEYEAKNGVSTLITLDDSGHVLPQFAMHASSETVGVTYPIDTTVTLENETTEMLVTTDSQTVPMYYDYKKTGEYMYHVNLGLVERSKIDLAVTSDVYNVTTTVNEKQEDYIYNERGFLSIFDANLKQTETYRNIAYTRELYNADYQYRVQDYQMNSLNELDRNGNDKTEEIKNIQKVKTEETEERVFVTYKITLVNQVVLQAATINEITDYFDPTYKLVEEDTYQKIQKSDGTVENKLVAKQSFFVIRDDENAIEYKLNWEQTGMAGGLKSMKTMRTNDGTVGLEDVIIGAGDEIYVFVTFEVEKDAERALQLGNKQNIVEISNYTSLEIGSENKEHSLGLIDKDSEPDNLSVGYYNDYEDDTDAAPILNLKLYSTDLRTINGYAWDDKRTVKLSTGQLVGNGEREETEEKINGVRVQLIEIIKDPETGAEYEYVWKQMYTGEDSYSYIGSAGTLANPERGQTVSAGSVITDTNLGEIQDGEYKFHDYLAGNYIVRFIYGDTYKTYLADGSENAQGEGRNDASFNGHDYKSTAYQKGNNLYAEWYDLNNSNMDSKLYSDAKDDSTRRKVVNSYSSTIQNDKAEILASFDGRVDKDYYDTSKQEEARNRTWMFADTAKLNVNIEYNTTESNGLKDLGYNIQNIDFGLEERPETKLELTKEITDIKITLASGETIINTAAGMSQNVNWVANQRQKEEGYDYKRDNLKYTYRQGKVHIYMDEEVMQGTNIQITYKITVTNKSEIDYTGQNGEPGYTYYTGIASSSDKIVTTKVDKIIDYVDNSLTFRKVDSPDWSLIETMSDFTVRNDGGTVETQKMDWAEFMDYVIDTYGEQYASKNYREVQAAFQVYEQTGKITGIGSTTEPVDEDTTGSYLSNFNVLKNMKENGYLNKDLSIVKTKSAKTQQVPISQVLVTKALENTELKPGQSTSVQLVLSKTLSPRDEDDTLDYSNMAEILQYSNSVGRRDMDAVPGNQEPDAKPDKDEFEYDTDFTERIIITPPTGENKAFYYVITTLVLITFTCDARWYRGLPPTSPLPFPPDPGCSPWQGTSLPDCRTE